MTATRYRIEGGYIVATDEGPGVPQNRRLLSAVSPPTGGWKYTELEAVLHRANTQPDLVEALDKTLALIRNAQERLCTHLVPDGSNDEHEALNDLLYMFDGPEQREIEGKARAARIAAVRAVKEGTP